MSYTTGIGAKSPQHPLHIDPRVTGQAAPPGLTIFGPLGFKARGSGGNRWSIRFFTPFESWPTTEAYWDMYVYGPSTLCMVGCAKRLCLGLLGGGSASMRSSPCTRLGQPRRYRLRVSSTRVPERWIRQC
jgi:hypothetical protein